MLFCSLTTNLLSALCYDQRADSAVLAVPALFCLCLSMHCPKISTTATIAVSTEFYAFFQVRLLPLLLLAAHCWGSRQRRESSSFFLNQMPHQFTALKVFEVF